MEDQIA